MRYLYNCFVFVDKVFKKGILITYFYLNSPYIAILKWLQGSVNIHDSLLIFSQNPNYGGKLFSVHIGYSKCHITHDFHPDFELMVLSKSLFISVNKYAITSAN